MSEKIKGDDLIIPAKLTVVSGSTLPRSQVQQREEAISLYKDGAIDTEELLAKLDWPNRRRVLRRMMQGPLASFFERLEELGFPDLFVDTFGEIGQMEDKDFAKDLKDGKLPSFAALLAGAQQDGSDLPPEPTPVEQAEIEHKRAQARKENANADKLIEEARLAKEKIMTERVQQNTMLAGVEFDEEKLKIERAKVVADIEKGEVEEVIKDEELTQKSKETTQGPYREKGGKSNNKDKKK